jgi:hypothetical protein
LHIEHFGQKRSVSFRNLGKTRLGSVEGSRGDDIPFIDTLEKHAIVGLPMGGVYFWTPKKILHHYRGRKNIFG